MLRHADALPMAMRDRPCAQDVSPPGPKSINSTTERVPNLIARCTSHCDFASDDVGPLFGVELVLSSRNMRAPVLQRQRWSFHCSRSGKGHSASSTLLSMFKDVTLRDAEKRSQNHRCACKSRHQASMAPRSTQFVSPARSSAPRARPKSAAKQSEQQMPIHLRCPHGCRPQCQLGPDRPRRDPLRPKQGPDDG